MLQEQNFLSSITNDKAATEQGKNHGKAALHQLIINDGSEKELFQQINNY